MEVQFGPNPVEESNLLYKLQRKVKVFKTCNSLAYRGYNLLTTSSKYGIVFVATPQGVLSVYNIKELINSEVEPRHLSINIKVQPTHIAINCDQEWLAVIGGQMLFIYKVTDFQNSAVGPSISIKCQVNPSTFLSSVQWNPCIPDTIALVYFDGTLVVSQVNTMQTKQIQSNARCLCWSPKGKQLVTGNLDGTLCQYKPDLSPMKSVPAPNLFEGAPIEALAIHWISTFQFAVVFKNASDNSRPAVTIVNTPKGGKPSCLNFEDICYSMGSSRPWYYYLQGLSQWNLIMASSSNSMEIATLASKDSANWLQWCQSDEARPELPLTDKKQENYPVGLCIDIAAAHQLPWGENEVLPHMPFLLALSHTGMMTIFNIINLDKAAPQICTPIQALSLPEAALTSEIPDDMPSQPQPVQDIPKPQPVVQQSQPVAQPPQAVRQLSQPIAQPLAQQVAQQPPAINQQMFSLSQTLPKIEQSPSTGLFSLAQDSTASNATQKPPPDATAVKVETNTPSAAEIDKSKADAAALKQEQEKANKAKLERELWNILIREYNDFQSELHKFRVNTCENQIKIQQQLDVVRLDLNLHSMNGEQLKKECALEELKESLVQLKLELVRACAAVAEARTQAEAKEHYEWSQTDPLTTKRFSSIKQLAYYVQTQLDQAQRELDYKWDNVVSKSQHGKGDRMLRPILDDVYQPLVKQQEIICRQQAVLRTLKNTLNECNTTPFFKSTSLLRNTPFKNKDPLSKLTKNILNMSIEPQDNKDKELSSQKLDALRDMLSNHRPKKIKPVSVELRQHLDNMRRKYEKGVKERAEKRDVERQIELQKQEQIKLEMERQEKIKIEAEIQAQARIKAKELLRIKAAKEEQRRIDAEKQKLDMKPQINTEFPPPVAVPQINALFKNEPKANTNKEAVAAFAPTIVKPTKPAFASVSRTLFNDGQKSDISSTSQPQTVQPVKIESSEQTLKEYLKGDVELPKICTPTAFSTSKPAPATSTAVFSSKPIAEMSNMFSKFTKPTDVKSTKPASTSDATGEMETSSIKSPIQIKEKPLGSIFSLKGSTPLTNVQNVPDVVKNPVITFGKTESKPKTPENEPKENVQVEKIVVKKEELKPFTIQSVSVPPSFSAAQRVFVVDPKKPNEIKIEKSLPASFFTSTPTTIPASTTMTSTPQVSATVTINSVTSPKPETSEPPSEPKPEKEAEKPKIEPEPITKTESSTPIPVTEEAAKSLFSSASKSLFSSPEAKTSESETVTMTPTTSAFGFTFGQTQSFGTTPSFGQTESSSTTSLTSTAQNVFSAANSAFGTSTTTSSIFTSQPASSAPFSTSFATSPGAVFGSVAQAFQTQAPTQSIFGSAPSSPSVFAATTTNSAFATTTASSVFATTTASSVFAPTTATSIFGSAPVFGAGQSVFGSAAFGSSSVFGTATPQASVFGAQNTNSGSAFGDGGANLFASASISTTSASQSGGSIFGGSSGFGGTNTNVFGAKSTFSGSNPTATSIFGGGGGGTSFGEKPATDFWGGATNTSTFGSNGFGQAATTASAVFGGGSFSQPSTGQPFGSPQKTSVFGTPQQQSAPAFGGSPVFGSKPAFGSPTSFGGSAFGSLNKSPGGGFGSSATFGGGAAFGGAAFGNTSPGKVFGGAAPSFGAPTQSNATFENLANQNTVTFGNLAQHSGQAAAAPAFNTSPSFTGWRG